MRIVPDLGTVGACAMGFHLSNIPHKRISMSVHSVSRVSLPEFCKANLNTEGQSPLHNRRKLLQD